MEDILSTLLNSINETLATAIVVLTASLFIYNLTRNLRNRIARTSGIVLACVTIVSLCDVLISMRPSSGTLENIVRAQWIGIAFVPAATFHLSDALLATTGLPSRGRRRRVARLLYFIGALFIIAAAFSNILIIPIIRNTTLVNILSGTLFSVYVVYFAAAIGVSFINVQRAKQRCLTRDTRRRMGYLQFAMLTPALGIFPYSVLLGLSETASVGMLFLVNIANTALILMLLFLSYPLSFFGTQKPDRVVKADLMRFMLRGPATALLAVAVINLFTPATRILGLTATSIIPFAVVVVILFWQWLIAIAIPWLQQKFIYNNEDDDQLEKLQDLSERLLTRSDLRQLLDAVLSSTCDYLQVSTAFVVSLVDDAPELVASVGPTRPNANWLQDEKSAIISVLATHGSPEKSELSAWQTYWITPLFGGRTPNEYGDQAIIGFLGIQARSGHIDLTTDEQKTFHTQVKRAAETLEDMNVQSEIYAALEGLLPQINITRSRAAEVEYRPGRNGQATATPELISEREQIIEQVRAALRHYWGGPGLTSSRLLEFHIVRGALAENAENPARALRSVLQKAIDLQRPEGERKLLSPEWMVYNILEMRFIERDKVRDVANRLALSEPDFYRKQKVAIEAVANTIIDLEMSERRQD
ncbi:MAG: hypothetical protein J0L63_01375 [Anaerolineae bacterium]|nr:hypothetical protein [Anaerolineae bacterium]